MQSEFWLLMKTTSQSLGIVDFYPGNHLPVVCIVELTPDGISFIWLEVPYFESEDVVDAQDPDYAIDGEWLFENGFFHRFEDFKKTNGFDPYHFLSYFLDIHTSIRDARSALAGLRAEA